jgi:MerR family transcriptional regulator, light-induced transcriptional regulator
MNAFTIKDVENLSGIQAHTLRIWEQRYSFLKPQRSNTNIRYYTNEELKAILNVALLNRFGYRISRISKMSAEEIAEKIMGLLPNEAQHQHIINQMLEQMIDMQLDHFDELLSQIIRQFGLAQAFTQIIFPFLERIGMLWAVGRVNAAQEHFVSNIIRQKLLAETEALPTPQQSDKKILLFLPEGELHEIGILFIQYLIKQQGLQNWYLGANVPVSDVSYVADTKKPSHLYTHLTAVGQSFSLEKFVSRMHELQPDTPIIVSGPVTFGYTQDLPGNVRFYNSPQEILDFIQSLTKKESSTYVVTATV